MKLSILLLALSVVVGGCATAPMERSDLVTRKGTGLVLIGTPVKAGDRAPNFRAVTTDGSIVRLSELKGQVVLISAVPKLGTKVCSLQTARFNQEAAGLKGVKTVTISADETKAQGQFCSANKIESLLMLSDKPFNEFGRNYGVLVKELNVLSRSIWVVDASGKVVYSQIVPELTQEPDYDKALAAAKAALK